MVEIANFLTNGELPADKGEARKLKTKAARYQIENDELYKRSYNGILLRCLRKEESRSVLEEIHDGNCGNHSGSHSLMAKVLRAGYFWINMLQDCVDYVRKCEPC